MIRPQYSIDTPSTRMQISIVIPAKNEERFIGTAIETVHACLAAAGYGVEVIVVNDGSVDQTEREALRAARGRNVRCISLPWSLGEGGAIASGFRVSAGEFVGFIDADLEYPPEALPEMTRQMSIGSGHKGVCAVAVRVGAERLRLDRITSLVGRYVACVALRLGIRDTQAGLKLFPGWFAREVLSAPNETGWMFDVEALVLAAEYGMSFVEIPVVMRCVRRRSTGIRDMVACSGPLLQFAARRWLWSMSKR